MRIFIIDDEECIRQSFRMHLEELGHEIITVKSPSRYSVTNSLDCSRDKPCDYILFIDSSGLEFIELMDSKGCRCVLKNTFVMSGNLNLTDKAKAEELGCTLLQKPIRFDEIESIIEKCKRINEAEKLSEKESCEEARKELTRNNNIVEDHNRTTISNTRKHERFKVNNCVCLLQIASTARTFSAKMVDVSEGGVQLEINASPDDLNFRTKTNLLKILGCSTQNLPVPLSGEPLRIIWQNNQKLGCAFIAI
jgi:DNA-binding NtrC family response regulator